jgi:hypothetical protein
MGNIGCVAVCGVEGVVSYSTAIRLNFLFRRMFGRDGLKFSLSESDSKLPLIGVCRSLKAKANEWRSSESLKIELLAPAPCAKLSLLLLLLLLLSFGGSVGLLELLSSVGCGGHAKNTKFYK